MSLKVFTTMVSEIRAKKFQPIYVLEGDEPYFIDRVADVLEAEVLTEAEKSFNFQIMYGRDVSILDIITAARRFPMMANHQLILVREAQHLKNIENLLPYVKQCVPSTILVLLYKGKKINKATKLGKALKSFGVLTTAKLKDYEMTTWVNGHVRTLGLKIDPRATEFLIQASGNNLHKVSSELDKIQANMEGRKEITADDISKHTGHDKEYNIFELMKSLGERNSMKCLTIVNYFNANPKDNPFILTLFNIFNYFKKIHLVHFSKSQGNNSALANELGLNPYFVGEYVTAAKRYPPGEIPRIFELIHEFDLKSKGISGGHINENELLTELIVRIIK